MDISRHAEVGWVDNLIGRRIVEDSLGVDTGLVGESTESGDVVVEGNVNLNSLGDQILNVLELVEVVLAGHILSVGNNHACHQSSKRSNTVSLTNTQHRGIDMSGTSLQGTVGIGNGAARIVVEVSLDIAADNTTKGSDQVINLSWRGAAHSVGNTDPVNTDLINGGVDGEEIDQVGSERVFAGKSDLNVVRLDVVDDFNSGVGDIGHILSVGVFHQVGRSTNDDVTLGNISMDALVHIYGL